MLTAIRGMKATHDIKEGEFVFSIPFALLMTVETAAQSPLGEVFEKHKDIQRQDNWITILLIVLKGRQVGATSTL